MKGRGSKRALSELIFPPSTWNHNDVKTVAGGLVRFVSWRIQTSPPSVKIFLISNFGRFRCSLYLRYGSALSNELRGDTYDMLSLT